MTTMTHKKSLNPEQIEAVTYGSGPLVIIAGAGTGKTTVITERINHLILHEKIDPSRILALTFTEKAALEMEERIDIALPYGVTNISVGTFHSFCERILRQDAFHIGLTTNYKLLTEADSVFLLKKNLFTLKLDYFRPLGNPTKFLQGLLQHFNRLKDEDISPNEYETYATKISEKGNQTDEEKEETKKILELSNAYRVFETIKIQEGFMDFSDLIANTLQLFRKRKHVLANYQKQFDYILIDEFQDTNVAQNQLAMLLTQKSKNITIVADDDQAIYAWRGAAISNIMQFTHHYPATKIVSLTKNYRSSQAILNGAYQLIQKNNPNRLEVQEHINKKLSSLRKISDEPINMILADSNEHETEEVIKTIISLIKKKKYSFKDFAILVRANDHALPFMHTCDRMRIPYQFLGPGKLFQEEEIKDIISYLKVLVNYDDSVSLYRVLTMSVFHIPATDIATLLNYAKKRNLSLFTVLSVADDIFLSEETREKIKKIYTMITNHLALVSKESAGHILYSFLKDSGFLEYIVNGILQEEKVQNIVLFFEKIKSFETQRNESSIFAVSDWIDLSLQTGENALTNTNDWIENNAVNILTVHASKGLEFPVVFLVNLVHDRFPSRERREQIPIPKDLLKTVLPNRDYHIEEERRLFYVGITRAQEYLFLTAAKLYGEGKREKKLSPFISETLGLATVENSIHMKKNNSSQLSLLDDFPEKSNSVLLSPRTYQINYLSYSQIHTFDICPLHYKLKYLLKIPVSISANQSFGISIHSVLRDFYQKSLTATPSLFSDITSLLKTNWIAEGYTSKEHEKIAFQKALSVLTHYFQTSFDEKKLPLAVELPFDFFIDRKLKIGGRIDRIDFVDDETIEIIDYKTGNNIPTERELKTDLQLTTYALAAENFHHAIFSKKINRILLSLLYIEENKKITTIRTPNQLEEGKKIFIEKSHEIATSNFLCSNSIFCRNCEYKMLCKVT
jgi:DNA helicase-2/ATP-dependent DNA helicase PcrA